VDLLNHEIGDYVVIPFGAEPKPRLRVQLGDVISRRLDVRRAYPEPLGDLAPSVRYELLEAVADQPVWYRLFEAGIPQLQHEALAQVACGNSRRIQILNRGEHFEHLRFGVE